MPWPEALPGWMRIQPEGERYPTYRRSDGWKVTVFYMDDVQIACSHDSALYIGENRVSCPGAGWGSYGITARMQWVNDKFGLPPAQRVTAGWEVEVRAFLAKLTQDPTLPEQVKRDALWLMVVGTDA